MYRTNDHNVAKEKASLLSSQSVKPFLNPWRKAPLGAIFVTTLFFGLVWPEVTHQVEGGLVKRAAESVVVIVQGTGVGKLTRVD